MKRFIIAVLLLVAVCLVGCDRIESLKKGPVLQGVAGETATWSFYEETGALFIEGTGAIDDLLSANFYEDPKIHQNGDITFTGGFIEKITRVVIEDGITAIGNNSFSLCIALERIDIPDSVTVIDESAFFACYALKDIQIPNGVTEIGNWTFHKCKSLTAVTIPDGVTSIGDRAFSLCHSLAKIEIPDSVVTINENAFWGCDALVDVTVPPHLEEWAKANGFRE